MEVTRDSTFIEKMGLLTLAAFSILALSVIALMALRGDGTIDPNVAGLLGVIVGGLIAVSKDIIAAVRSYAMSAQLGKVTDQLAASGPVVDATVPADAAEGAQEAVDAAQVKADKIAGQVKP